MKDIVFAGYFEFIEKKFDFKIVDQLLEQSQLTSDGVCTSVGAYADSDLFELHSNLNQVTDFTLNDLLEAYGKFLSPELIKIMPSMIQQLNDSFSLLQGVDDITHVEARKLPADAELPMLATLNSSGRQLQLELQLQLQLMYRSSHSLVCSAKRLILRCLSHFNEQAVITIQQQVNGCPISIARSS